jgi:hypothetical protein
MRLAGGNFCVTWILAIAHLVCYLAVIEVPGDISGIAPVEDFKAALASKHLVLIGDSLMRYQYIALVYQLRHGKVLTSSMYPNPVQEKDWQDWFHYFNGTTTSLSPFEFCDCYRGKRKINENRFYFDRVSNIAITFIQFFGGLTHGHWSSWSDPDSLRMPRQAYLAPQWTLPLTEVLNWASRLYPTNMSKILVLNSGFHEIFHGMPLSKPEYGRAVAAKAVSLFEGGAIWKSTSADRNKTGIFGMRTEHLLRDASMVSDVILPGWHLVHRLLHLPHIIYNAHTLHTFQPQCSFPKMRCFNISWTYDLDGSHYWDDIHFKAEIYNRMNQQLLLEFLRAAP